MSHKRMWFIFGAVTLGLLFGMTGVAFAQTQTPPNGVTPNSVPFGGMGRWGGGGMMGRWSQGGQVGAMHNYLIAAIAPKLGIGVDALNAELAAGKTLWQVAEAKGISADQFQTMFLEAKQEALSKMVADGVITQAQADWMLARMNWMLQNGRGFGGGGMGSCHGGGWQSPRGRWSPTPAPGSGS